MLERRGLLIADPVDRYLDFEAGSSLDQIQAASIAYRTAIGPHAGRKALTLYSVPISACSELERLCRYITRPPIATKRLSVDDHGRVVYRYNRPFRDGSTHVVLEPLDFIARLAALVPRPRLNLTRFHGIFAPNFKHRHQIVPRHPQRKGDDDKPLAPMNWAQRLKRVFQIDIESCPNCGGKLRVIACTRNGFASPLRTYGPCMASALACAEDPLLIRKILDHVNHGDTHSSNAARGPPGEVESLRDGIRADPIHRAVEDERGRDVRAGSRRT